MCFSPGEEATQLSKKKKNQNFDTAEYRGVSARQLGHFHPSLAKTRCGS